MLFIYSESKFYEIINYIAICSVRNIVARVVLHTIIYCQNYTLHMVCDFCFGGNHFCAYV